jgi:uncharacterized protein (TIGR03437 family)
VAPDSLAALFGVNLAGSTAWSTLDQNGQLPTGLGGARVEVNGEAAGLLYVSSSQINFVVPGDAATGTVGVLVRNTATGAAQSGTMLVENTAAGVFSADGSGKGPGAILNAVTYATAPFLTVTDIAGSDQPTILAVYATGIRYAANVGASATDASGNTYNLTVVFAGPAPGYFGLDQVNIVLPPDLDGTGVVSLFLTADGSTSNVVSFPMASLPANSISLAGLSFSPSYVNGGNSATLTVSLNGVARSIGLSVSLSSNNAAAQPPFLVTVPAGKASLQVTVSTLPVTAVQTATITGRAAGASQTAALEIDPASALQLSTLSVAPASVLGGKNVSATVALTGTAAPGGAKIGISSDNTAAHPPAAVSVPFGSSSATFSIPTSVVTASQTCNITATLAHSSQTAQIAVVPALQLVLANSSVVGGSGNTVSGTVTIADSASIVATIILQSSNWSATVPNGGVVIPSGQNSASFTITTAAVTVAQTVTITATYGGLKQSATLAVNPPASATLTGVTVSPTYVTGGTNATGTVTLGAAAPVGGINVILQSSSPAAAQVQPSVVTVQQGTTTASFTIQTYHVTSTQTVTITATAGVVKQTAVLTVQ